ncbi:50S ribosomal protein L35 [Cerasicoccus arenae]|uniref:Large ribosomal subunit protein bL35 n=1 Tax=Cerasicoccus arenae TaxID=424488 RepID=A0A8J3GCV3_9BACT|nr:50S ribosomal protein L35 [Cerasicoccus arenae]MBK1857084.1 50S ribosomal protein L35 [Cerasicoccus arenae]GHB92275.1 50S ribosomal protein L35 [Cerasicoccus arenae]
MSQKTRKAMAKRFKITGTGKVRRFKANHRHLLRNKSQKQKRSMRQSHSLGEGQSRQVLRALPHSH